MKKKLLSLFLCLCLTVCAVSTVAFSAQAKEKFVKPGITGTFIQPWLYNSYNASDWDKEFSNLAALGVDTVIMGDMAVRDNAAAKWNLYYPSKLADFEGNRVDQGDCVTKLMDACKKYGMKLYLGIGLDGDWWGKDLSRSADAKWMMDIAAINCRMVRELHDLYAAKYGDTFGGYYWVHEIWNHNSWDDATSRAAYAKNLAAAFNVILETINEVDPNRPLLFSPFATQTGFASKESVTKFYTEFFKQTNFRKIDAMLPMDNVGGGGQTLDSVEAWTKAYYDAFNNVNFKLQFWANCESFVQPHEDGVAWTTCTVDRFVKQIEIASKYCSKILNFAYSHYMSPINTDPGFNNAFMDYLKTGKLDAVGPTFNGSVKITKNQSGGKNTISFDPFTDAYGIARYRLYRINASGKTTLVKENLVVRKDGSRNRKLIKNEFNSVSIPGGDTYYGITAVDCAGNESEMIVVPVDGDHIGNQTKFKVGDKGYWTMKEFLAQNKEISSVETPHVSETASVADQKTDKGENKSTAGEDKSADETSQEESTSAEESASEAEGSSEITASEKTDDASETDTSVAEKNAGGKVFAWVALAVGVIALAVVLTLVLRKKKAALNAPEEKEE